MGVPVAAIVIRKEKDLVAHFRAQGAVSVSTARTRNDLGVDDGMAWRRLTGRAVLRETSEGKYFLDEPSWAALRGTRRRLMLVMFFLVVMGGLAWFLSRPAS